MAEGHVSRRLAAILAADVVGYSRLMGADEAGTLAALKRHRETVFSPAVAAHNGRIVKLIGDGVIAEFGSVVDAVSCALSVQRSSAATSDPSVSQPAIVLRIGINLGDIIIEGDDIYGDGVNIAGRLEPLAEPGGVCVSSIVNESVGNRIDARFQDGGDVSVKNIDRPIRIWKWHPGATVADAPAKPQPNVPTASIAVLPFTNMSGDPDQEYFSDGISEDIITDRRCCLLSLDSAATAAVSARRPRHGADVRRQGETASLVGPPQYSIRRLLSLSLASARSGHSDGFPGKSPRFNSRSIRRRHATPAADMLWRNAGVAHEIVLREEEVSDVTLVTFHVFDKEIQAGQRLACGCGGGCCLFARASSSGFGNDAYSLSPGPIRPAHKKVRQK